MSMDDAVTLNEFQQRTLAEMLLRSSGDVLVAVDDIDRALKVKVAGRWSPPIGVMAQRDPARSNADDLAHEALGIRPVWWGSAQDDQPAPVEYKEPKP